MDGESLAALRDEAVGVEEVKLAERGVAVSAFLDHRVSDQVRDAGRGFARAEEQDLFIGKL